MGMSGLAMQTETLAWHERPENKKARKEYAKGRYIEKKTFLDAIKVSNGCDDCGEHFPAVCVDFDHRNPETKVSNVSRLLSCSWETLEKEIAKCDIVCANCHRLRTFPDTRAS